MQFLQRRKLRKQLKSLLHHAHTLRASREDIMNVGQLAFLDEHIAKVETAAKAGDIDTMTQAGTALDECVTKLNPPQVAAWWRENFDVLVVAISVAMAFRAYFYQPFKIPTGSMQPTLYGIHSEPRPPTDATLMDKQPLKFAKWLITGESFQIIRAKDRGTVSIYERDSRTPGYVRVVVGSDSYYVSSDVVEHYASKLWTGLSDYYARPICIPNGQKVKEGDVLWSDSSTKKSILAKVTGTVQIEIGDANRKSGCFPVIVAGQTNYVPCYAIVLDPSGLRGGVRNKQIVKKGDILWSGIVRSGDFLFVNRWKWNFCHPQRGEIMVFSTAGIVGLQQGTHYIKRMTGLPGDTLQIKAPNLLVNGITVTTPERIGQISRMEKIGDWAPAYAGFNPSYQPDETPGKTLASEVSTVILPASHYYAMGDNSFNSYDSRFWGPVPERNLLGPASVVHWPFTSPRWGWIK